MKPIYLTKEAEQEMIKELAKKLRKEWDDFKNNLNETKFSFSQDFSMMLKAKEKMNIIFTQSAYLRMKALVNHFDTEVGWYGLVERKDKNTFRVYDVKICKQVVSGAKVDTEDEDTLEFFNSLTDDEAEHMHFQAHSHVKMSTSASTVDMQNQADVIRNMGKTGFYIFQIWNKSGEVSTYLYDLDNNLYYESKEVEIMIEDELGTLDDYIASIEDLVQERKIYPYQNGYYSNGYYYGKDYGYWSGKNYESPTQKKETKKETKEETEIKDKQELLLGLMQDALEGGWYDERWDYMT